MGDDIVDEEARREAVRERQQQVSSATKKEPDDARTALRWIGAPPCDSEAAHSPWTRMTRREAPVNVREGLILAARSSVVPRSPHELFRAHEVGASAHHDL